MNILVTGGLGFVGYNVVQLLEKAGHRVVIVDSMTDYGIVPAAELNYVMAQRRMCISAATVIYRTDINTVGLTSILKEHAIERVVHLASFPRQKVVNSNPQAGSRTMSEGLLNLLEACVAARVGKFVYVSSSMVYGNFKNTRGSGIDEMHATNPIGQYGIMKLAGEWLVKDYSRRHSIAHTILRPTAVYGPVDVEDRVVSKFLLTAMRGGTIQVNGADEALDFTYVSDTADAVATATVSDTTDNMTYNIARGRGRTLKEAAELAVAIVGSGSIQVNEPDSNFPSRGQLDTTRAYNDFGFHPTVDIEQGFREYYEWLKDSVYWSRKTV
jgi:UDP-glucose 4-epimerase